MENYKQSRNLCLFTLLILIINIINYMYNPLISKAFWFILTNINSLCIGGFLAFYVVEKTSYNKNYTNKKEE